jgi:uncharacterized protein
LEFALNEIPTFGVGRIHSMFMYPMSFDEFLGALGMQSLLQAKEIANPTQPLLPVLHDQLVALFRTYLMVGGMPEVVSTWVSAHSYEECQSVQKEIVYTYEVDFAKYKKRANTTLLRLTLHSAAHQIGSKFVYSQVSRDFRSVQIKEALSLLTLAGLLIPVYNTAANGFPLGAEADESCAKYLFLDSGLLLSILGMDLGSITTLSEQILIGNATDLVNKGHITEMVAGLEIIKNMPPDSIPSLFFWMRSAKSSLAEVDYVMAKNMKILPIEVKADSWNSAADGFQKWNSESLYPGRINENLCQFVERWQIFVRYFMIEMKQMLYALFLQKALYFFYIWSVASYCYYLYFLFPLILCKTFCSAFSFGKQSYRFCQQ